MSLSGNDFVDHENQSIKGLDVYLFETPGRESDAEKREDMRILNTGRFPCEDSVHGANSSGKQQDNLGLQNSYNGLLKKDLDDLAKMLSEIDQTPKMDYSAYGRKPSAKEVRDYMHRHPAQSREKEITEDSELADKRLRACLNSQRSKAKKDCTVEKLNEDLKELKKRSDDLDKVRNQAHEMLEQFEARLTDPASSSAMSREDRQALLAILNAK